MSTVEPDALRPLPSHSQDSSTTQRPEAPVRSVLTTPADEQRSSLADHTWIRLSGRFLDAATQEPIAAVQVATYAPSTGTKEEFRTNQDGTFRIEIQRPGTYRFSATHPRYEPVNLAYIRLSAVGSCDLGDLILQPRVRRLIRVLDSASTPVAQARIFLCHAPVWSQTNGNTNRHPGVVWFDKPAAITDIHGEAEVYTSGRITTQLIALKAGFHPLAVLVPRGSESLDIVLRDAPAISVQVVCDDGQSPEGAMVAMEIDSVSAAVYFPVSGDGRIVVPYPFGPRHDVQVSANLFSTRGRYWALGRLAAEDPEHCITLKRANHPARLTWPVPDSAEPGERAFLALVPHVRGVSRLLTESCIAVPLASGKYDVLPQGVGLYEPLLLSLSSGLARGEPFDSRRRGEARELHWDHLEECLVELEVVDGSAHRIERARVSACVSVPKSLLPLVAGDREVQVRELWRAKRGIVSRQVPKGSLLDVVVSADGHAYQTLSRRIEGPLHETVILPAAFCIAGTVHGIPPSWAGSVTVVVESTSEPGWRTQLPLAGSSFEIQGCAPGSYTVELVLKGEAVAPAFSCLDVTYLFLRPDAGYLRLHPKDLVLATRAVNVSKAREEVRITAKRTDEPPNLIIARTHPAIAHLAFTPLPGHWRAVRRRPASVAVAAGTTRILGPPPGRVLVEALSADSKPLAWTVAKVGDSPSIVDFRSVARFRVNLPQELKQPGGLYRLLGGDESRAAGCVIFELNDHGVQVPSGSYRLERQRGSAWEPTRWRCTVSPGGVTFRKAP